MLDVSLSTGMLTNQILFERKICCRDVNSLTINNNFLIDHSEQNNIYRTFRIIDDTGDKLLLKVSHLECGFFPFVPPPRALCASSYSARAIT